MSESYIVEGVRTARAKRNGAFATIHPVDLLSAPLVALTQRTGLDPARIDDLFVGCVTQSKEQAWCIARAAILATGWPITVPGLTINRLCASSLEAVNLATASIKSGALELVIAGGVEHMTRAPMFSDCGGEASPLIAANYPELASQGVSCERICRQYGFNRTQLDEYAALSHNRAQVAQAAGRFTHAIVPVNNLAQDDAVRPGTTQEKLALLKTPFAEDGLLTAGNSSSIVDGAAAIMLASEMACKKYSLKKRAKVSQYFSIGSDPLLMLTGPTPAIRGLLDKQSLTVSDIDLWEINEAFAPVPLLTMHELGIDIEKLNVNGGAIALGHPLGATGAMLAITLLEELERRDLKRGIVAMCVGLGMGVATLIER